MTACGKKIEPTGIIGRAPSTRMADPDGIAQEPVSVLFSPQSVAKRDVWEIDLVRILDMLVAILERRGGGDLKVAGMAALSSSVIYRMKVESIFALQRAAAERRPERRRGDADIPALEMPFRHESTYPVSLDDLLELLQSLIASIANPRTRRGAVIEPADPPDFGQYMVSLEGGMARFQDLILSKVPAGGSATLQAVVAALGELDSIRCFIAALFLAKDGRVGLAQRGDDILVTRAAG